MRTTRGSISHPNPEERIRMQPQPAAGGSPSRLTVALALESDGPGGAEWTLIHLAVGLRERGHSVVPIIPERGVGWLGGQLQDRGFAPRTFRIDHPFDVGCVLRLRRLLARDRVSLVHAHEFTLSVFATAAATIGSIPSIVTLHSAQRFPDRLRRRVAIRWAARRAFAATTVSDATRAAIVRSLGMRPEEWKVVANGVPVPHGNRAETRRALGVDTDTRLLLAVGNLYPVKGHDILVRAMEEVGRAEPAARWKVAIAGRGEARERLEALIRELGLESRVSLLGFRDDVGSLLHAADLFVHPSRSEGLPLAIIEAMSIGLPVIASDVGGIPEVVAQGVTGLLVTPEDPSALAGAIRQLLVREEDRRRMGNAALRVARESYGLDTMVDRYVALYQEAMWTA
jgi:glycosyltransferase involved in cell wall biosynthesis